MASSATRNKPPKKTISPNPPEEDNVKSVKSINLRENEGIAVTETVVPSLVPPASCIKFVVSFVVFPATDVTVPRSETPEEDGATSKEESPKETDVVFSEKPKRASPERRRKKNTTATYATTATVANTANDFKRRRKTDIKNVYIYIREIQTTQV